MEEWHPAVPAGSLQCQRAGRAGGAERSILHRDLPLRLELLASSWLASPSCAEFSGGCRQMDVLPVKY